MAAKKGIEVPVEDVVNYLRIEGDFLPAVARVAERQAAAKAAREAGIRVTARELQRAADGFRAIRDLNKASATEKWMKAVGITVETLEEHLETNILMAKLKDKLAAQAPKRMLASKPVKDLVRSMAYKEWLAKKVK